MNHNIFEQRSHLFLVTILLFLGFFLLMFGNNILSLTHPDEVFYIQSAKEMIKHKKWFTPMIFDHVQFEKPFFAFMLFASALKWFGFSPFVARFWPACFGLIGLGTTYWIAWMLFRKKRVAFLSGLILGTSFIYLALSRAVLTDMIFSVLVEISLGFFFWAYTDKKNQAMGWSAGFIFSAIAVLTKGLLGFCFPLGAMFFYLLLKRDLTAPLKQKSFWGGLALFFLISVPWHLVMYFKYGAWFIQEYFLNVHVRRLLASEHARLDNWYFYLALMFAGVLPWSLFWIPTLKKIVKDFRDKSEEASKILFLLAWIAGVYVFVQPAHSKLASYIFPVFPAIAILLAQTIDASLDSVDRHRRGLMFCGHGMTLLLIGIVTGGIFYARQHINIVGSMKPIYISSILFLIVSFLIFWFNVKKKYGAMIGAHALITASFLVMLFYARPATEPWVSCQDVAHRFMAIDSSDSVVLSSKFYVRGVRYYTDRSMAVIDINGKGFWSPHPIPFLNTEAKVIDFLKSQPVTYAVVKEGNVEDLKRIMLGQPFQLEDLGGAAGKYILRITQ